MCFILLPADFEDRSAVMVTITPAANPTAGSPHTLTCDPNSGTASPVQVQWFGPDGNQLQTGGGITVSTQSPFTLTFTQLRESNAGLYVCQATVGTPGSADSGCTSTQVTMQGECCLCAQYVNIIVYTTALLQSCKAAYRTSPFFVYTQKKGLVR